jgi:hypothetical protein
MCSATVAAGGTEIGQHADKLRSPTGSLVSLDFALPPGGGLKPHGR